MGGGRGKCIVIQSISRFGEVCDASHIHKDVTMTVLHPKSLNVFQWALLECYKAKSPTDLPARTERFYPCIQFLQFSIVLVIKQDQPDREVM